LSVQEQRLVDTADLIGDLGGGWSANDLHDATHPESAARAASDAAASGAAVASAAASNATAAGAGSTGPAANSPATQ
jgi:hypothetical protein